MAQAVGFHFVHFTYTLMSTHLAGEDEVLHAHTARVDLLQLPHHVGLDLPPVDLEGGREAG